MGLLDFLQSPDAQLGIGLLAAAGPTTDPNQSGFGQRLAGVMQNMDAQKQQALKMKLLQSQVDENASQNMLRQGQLARQQRQDDYYLGGGGAGGGGGGVAPMTAPGGGSAPQPQGGAAPGSALAPPGTPPPGRGKFAEWSQQYGIPVDALVADYFSNGGKGIAEMLYKRGAPDMQFVNGVGIDRNKTTNGQILPFVNTSANGTTTVGQVGQDGQLDVYAPRGAVSTARDYARAQAGLKPIKVFNPVTQREEYSNEAAVAEGAQQPPVSTGRLAPMAGAPGNVQSPGYSGGDRNAANAESIRVMQAELQKPDLTDADRAGITREIQRMQMQSGAPAQSGNFAAGPSAKELAANEAAKAGAVDTAKADVVRDTTKIASSKQFGQIMATTNRALELLKQGPTASGFGSMVDAGANFVGKSTKGADVASQLDTLSGWMTANVPRMEGPQSDKDVAQYRIMAAAVGDRTKPVAQRLAAAQELQSLQQKYAELNGLKPAGGATGDWSQEPAKPNLIQELPKTAALGSRVRDTATGKVLRFNGLQWKEE